MTVVTLDIADPCAVEKVWNEIERRHAARTVDPELRRSILARLGDIDPAVADEIRQELGEMAPAVVLQAHLEELVPDKQALGAFPRRETLEAPTATEWLAEDPRRLAGVVREMSRFTTDRRLVVAAVLDLADAVGIEQGLADRIVCGALKSLKGGRS